MGQSSIAYGYQDFPAGVDVNSERNKIIMRSIQDGLIFISDQDARPAGGTSAGTSLGQREKCGG